MSTLFGVLILDRNPFTYGDLPGLVQSWLSDAGGFSAAGLLIYFIYALFSPTDRSESAKDRATITPFMLIMGVLSLLCYVVVAVLLMTSRGEDPSKIEEYYAPGHTFIYKPPALDLYPRPLLMAVAGLFAILGFGAPFFRAMLKVAQGRVYAIAKLSFLEAIRNRYFYIFLIALVPFMFPAKWFVEFKPEDELRQIVGVSNILMQFLVLIPAVLMASFSIPNDIKRQTIYTIVTKPVQRFEIILGRFLGYLAVLTLGLAAMVVVGLIFIATTSIDEKAVKESELARMPIRGKLVFKSRKADFDGTSVGREFEYRKYIAGDPGSPQRAIWQYASVPASLTEEANGYKVEFTFDIFRLTKGEENKGVFVSATLVTHDCQQTPPTDPRDGEWLWANREKEQAYYREAAELLNTALGRRDIDDKSAPGVLGGAAPGKKEWDVADQLAEKYGFFKVGSVEVYDYHPASVMVPKGIFKAARNGTPALGPDGKPLPRLQVMIKCESRSQLLGMAEGDLYIVEGEKSFSQNYAKAMFGLWCRVAIVVALCIALSTYLAGVISMLTTLFLYLLGYAVEHLEDLARGTSTGGGPFRAMTDILQARQPTAQPGDSAIDKLNSGLDVGFQWLVRRIKNVVPDVEGYAWSHFVKEGFNINFEFLAMNLICLVGYLLPWAVLAFYLLRSREVADT